MLNRSIIQGRLVQQVELKQTPSGLSVASFTIATERNYSENNERQSDFIPCVAWRNTAEFISRYFDKGQKIIVEGSLQSRKWQDKNGNGRTAVELIVEKAYFDGDKKSEQENAQPSFNPNSKPDFEEVAPDGDFPF